MTGGSLMTRFGARAPRIGDNFGRNFASNWNFYYFSRISEKTEKMDIPFEDISPSNIRFIVIVVLSRGFPLFSICPRY